MKNRTTGYTNNSKFNSVMATLWAKRRERNIENILLNTPTVPNYANNLEIFRSSIDYGRPKSANFLLTKKQQYKKYSRPNSGFCSTKNKYTSISETRSKPKEKPTNITNNKSSEMRIINNKLSIDFNDKRTAIKDTISICSFSIISPKSSVNAEQILNSKSLKLNKSSNSLNQSTTSTKHNGKHFKNTILNLDNSKTTIKKKKSLTKTKKNTVSPDHIEPIEKKIVDHSNFTQTYKDKLVNNDIDDDNDNGHDNVENNSKLLFNDKQFIYDNLKVKGDTAVEFFELKEDNKDIAKNYLLSKIPNQKECDEKEYEKEGENKEEYEEEFTQSTNDPWVYRIEESDETCSSDLSDLNSVQVNRDIDNLQSFLKDEGEMVRTSSENIHESLTDRKELLKREKVITDEKSVGFNLQTGITQYTKESSEILNNLEANDNISEFSRKSSRNRSSRASFPKRKSSDSGFLAYKELMGKDFKVIEKLRWHDLSTYSLSMQSSRFELPIDIQNLEGLKPLEYLLEFTIISERRSVIYSKIFFKYRSGLFGGITPKDINKAVSDVFVSVINVEELMGLKEITLAGESYMNQRTFGVFCAFAERLLFIKRA
ncbi:DgyrCDS8878 [Dimorphilus gyrociliatus]|nr:DgyrCDS8878 [Dimorphilus gyrociliatus]